MDVLTQNVGDKPLTEMPQLVFTLSLKALDKSLLRVKLKRFLPTQLIPRGKTSAPYRINYMDGHVHSHSMP